MKPPYALAIPAVLAVLVAGCGGGGDDNSSGSSTHAAAPGGTSSNTVTIDNFKFMPSTLTVAHGKRVTVTNNDSTTHTATADNGSSFDTGDIDPGSSKTISVSKAGRYTYHCSIHPFMHGTLVVR